MVVVGERTQKIVGDAFDCHPLGAFNVKGKEKKILAYEVRSRLGGGGPETVAPVPPEADGGATGP
jgi:hypothetical protein